MTRLEQIEELVEFTLTDKSPKNKIVKLGVLKPHEVERIMKLTGFDLEGYERIMDRYGVAHTIVKHGNPKAEESRGLIAVTPKDFKKIPRILKTENIIFAGKNNAGKDCLLYEAIIGNTFYYVEEIRTGRKQLALQTLYKRKPR